MSCMGVCCGIERDKGACPCGVSLWRCFHSPEWDAFPEWVREGRRARLCEAGGYARVEVSLDVCLIHRVPSITLPLNILTTSARA